MKEARLTLNEVQEQEKLINGDRNQKCDYFWRGRNMDWEEA